MKRKNSFIVIVDGKSCPSKKKALSEIATLLEFPDVFGKNFDALRDYLTDLSWINSEIVVVVIKNYSYFLSDEDDNIKDIFFSIFDEVQNEGYQGDSELEEKDFYVFYSDSVFEPNPD